MRYLRLILRIRIKALFRAAIFGFVLLFFAFAGMFIYYAKDLPSAEDIHNLSISESTKIYDRTGSVVLYDIYGEEKRTIVQFAQIPSSVRYATIVAEDDDFYHHFGIDFRGIGRAVMANITNQGIRQGGSTITQQFVKNALLTPERTVSRKIKEIILTLELEWRYEKDQILEFYLNQVPYGNNAYGIEAASQTYFGKHAEALTIAESALLASLPKAPTYYWHNPDELASRKVHILNRMQRLGYITEEELEAALNEEISFSQQARGIQAPHFVMYVRQYLEETYGSDFLRRAGLRVYTTLDWELQELAEGLVQEFAIKNEKTFNAHNAALTAIDPKTGQILAMVGSRDYFDTQNDGNVNVATRPRQPGSSFKPFVYAAAFEKGYTPDTIVFDVPTEFNPDCSSDALQEKDQYGLQCYNPQNYDGAWLGPITLKEALAQSRNVPAVKVLYLAGITETLELANSLGINSLKEPSRYGLSLVLGGGEVTLLEETSAYSALATEGIQNNSAAILRIEDKNGEVLEEYKHEPQQILDKNISRQITSILSSNELRSPVFGEQNYLSFQNIPAAAKTGTTQDYRDAWTVGYTPSIAVGVWVGNNDNAEMVLAPGSQAAAPLWNAFVRGAYDIKSSRPDQETQNYFALPAPAEEKSFAPVQKSSTGKFILDGEAPSNDWFHTILHYVLKDDPVGDAPNDAVNDPQYINWEAAVRRWVRPQDLYTQDRSTSYGEAYSPATENAPSSNIEVSFFSPKKNVFKSNETIPVGASLQSANPLKSVRVYIDGETLLSRTFSGHKQSSFSFLEHVAATELDKNSQHKILVEGIDLFEFKTEKEFSFFVR